MPRTPRRRERRPLEPGASSRGPMHAVRRLRPLDAALIAFGGIVLGHALEMSNGFYEPVALAAAALAAVLVAAGAARLPAPACSEGVAAGVLVAGLLSNLVALATAPVGLYLASPDPEHHPGFLAGLAAATAFVVLAAVDPRRARNAWFPALLATYAVLGIWLIQASPRPHIDVITVFRGAMQALGRLQSPYSITFRNIYADEGFYAPGLVVANQVHFGFPYPPLNLLMALPAAALHLDVRYAELASLVAGAAWIGRSARGRIAPLAAAVLMFTPRTFFVLEQGWTEAMVLCWAGLTFYAAQQVRATPEFSARWPGLRAIALGLMVAAKQHMVVALLFAGWLGRPGEGARGRRRLVLGAVAAAASVTLPFLIWDPTGFWRSVVLLQLREPFRMDSLSVLVWLARAGWQLPGSLLIGAPLTAMGIGLALAWWRLPRTPAGSAVGLGLGFLLLFLFSKKAFCNYYFLVIGLLMAGVAAASADFDEGEPRRAGPPLSAPGHEQV